MLFWLHSRLRPLTILSILIGQWTVLFQVCCGNHVNDTNCPPDPKEVENLFKEFKNIAEERIALETKLFKEGKVVLSTERISDLSHLRQANIDPTNRENELKQIVFEAVTNKLIEKYNLTQDQVNECLPDVSLSGEYSSKAEANCQMIKSDQHCNASALYRTADGSCNNLQNPIWGSVGNCFVRMLPPRYVGASGFRQSVKGGPLPEPRNLSLNVHSHLDKPTHDVTHMYMFFGQLIDHEITQAPISITVEKLPIKCCFPGQSHPQCAPISISPADSFYSEFGTTCLSVVRAALCPTCALGPRQQVNQITSFIDASVIYGTNEADTKILRTNDGTGRMRVQKKSVGDLLPPSPEPENDQCSYVETEDICFQTGDPRANEHPPLASLQTIFVREHNRLADDFRKLNPSWNGEKVFQETRKIMGAMFQNIVYNEYLPITLGDEQLGRFQLKVSNERTKYDPKADPSITNEFTAAAFRFSHSLINSILANSPLNSTNGTRLLRDQFFEPFDLYKGILSPLMASVTKSPAQMFDRHMVPDLTNFLYRIRGTPAGLDLASININRGRDHGIPTYADMVHHCSEGKTKLTKFTSLVKCRLVSKRNSDILAQNYKSVEDIDLWTGILSENPLKGAIVGSTAACIIGRQFNNLKFGDRFFFEHGNQTGSFTYPQLKEIKKMTLSKLMCLNTDIPSLSEKALLFPSDSNPTMNCSSVQGVNLTLWK